MKTRRQLRDLAFLPPNTVRPAWSRRDCRPPRRFAWSLLQHAGIEGPERLGPMGSGREPNPTEVRLDPATRDHLEGLPAVRADPLAEPHRAPIRVDESFGHPPGDEPLQPRVPLPRELGFRRRE